MRPATVTACYVVALTFGSAAAWLNTGLLLAAVLRRQWALAAGTALWVCASFAALAVILSIRAFATTMQAWADASRSRAAAELRIAERTLAVIERDGVRIAARVEPRTAH